jgi:flagellar basal-body rod modification protein FlgD
MTTQIQQAATGSALSALAPGGAKNKTPAEEAQERFLTLLVTQMRNQDPLNPLDNAQVTTQLAQLNTVTGISQLNETLQGLAASFSAAQSMQAAALIGRSVMVAGDQLDLAQGQAVFGAELAQAVDRLEVVISDAAGKVVHRAEAGAQQAGVIALHWDGAGDAAGRAADGQYRFSLNAWAGGRKVEAAPLTTQAVTGVNTQSGNVQLNLGGGGSVTLAGVRQII